MRYGSVVAAGAVAAGAVAAGAAAATVAATAARIGLLGGPGTVPRGAGDNADGARAYCTAGLRPATPEGTADWRGVVVTEFTTGFGSCGPPVSSAARILGATVPEGAASWSLTTLGWAYVALLALGVAAAAGALAATAPPRALLVALPVLPWVVVPWWSRFALSTYAEPAGLLGATWLLLGLLVVAGTPPTARGARITAMTLIGSGGLVAMTAKPGYVPVGLVAVLALVTVTLGGRRGWRAHLAGAVAALLVVGLAAGPVSTLVADQQRTYGAVNTHHLVFGLLLPRIGPEVLPRLGLPPGAAAHADESYYWAGARGVPGWSAAIGERPAAARTDALTVLAAHPDVALGALHTAMVATLRPQLSYLPTLPRGAAPERDDRRTVHPETGAVGDHQRRWLDGIALSWSPSAFAVGALGAGLVTLLPRRRARPASLATGLLRVAAAAVTGAVGLCALTVVGDGFYELTKHVWPASYLLAVAAGCAVTAAGLSARRRWRPGRPGTGAGTGR